MGLSTSVQIISYENVVSKHCGMFVDAQVCIKMLLTMSSLKFFNIIAEYYRRTAASIRVMSTCNHM